MSAVINFEDGTKRLMGNRQLFTRLLGKFNGRQYFEAFRDAVGQEDYEAADKAIHALKGIAANLSMERLADVIVQYYDWVETKIETKARASDIVALVEVEVKAVEDAILQNT